MPTNNKEYMKEYMKEYNQRNRYIIECNICGIELKKYNIYAHNKSKTHQRIQCKINDMHQPN